MAYLFLFVPRGLLFEYRDTVFGTQMTPIQRIFTDSLCLSFQICVICVLIGMFQEPSNKVKTRL
ncbi:MAG: hypothetical protein LBL13_10835, partial [Bacteroidales bacterium]|nr:hypothetical protein [Bacteroidales bacterium]